jgi:hypothetical protein
VGGGGRVGFGAGALALGGGPGVVLLVPPVGVLRGAKPPLRVHDPPASGL